MTTTGKIALGAAVVIGGIVVYKLVSDSQNPVRQISKSTASPQANVISGFLSLGTSAFNYFSKQTPQQQVSPGVQTAPAGPWDSTSDIYLPLQQGHTAYEDSTTNDNLLS